MRRFAGYAAIFDHPDTGGDIVRRGAFARTLALRRAQGERKIGLLHQHDAAQRIGEVEHLSEDDRGLRVIARVGDDTPVAPGTGLSFGYRVRGSRNGTYRELTDLDLIEVSVVTRPMQPLARVLAVQNTDQPEGEDHDV